MNSIVLLLFLCALSVHRTSSESKRQRIGIIGAGIGGATAAHYMRELFGPKVEIDVYESGSVGGRLATLEIGGRHYETGGTIIHPRNMYMVNFTSNLGLKVRDPGDGRLAIFDGSDMVFDGSSWSVVTLLQLLWRYGKDLFKIRSYVNQLMDDFSRIYGTQDAGYSYTTVEGLLTSMAPEFVKKLEHSVEAEFLGRGFSERFVNELVLGAMRSNYGQSVAIQSFVGSVSMAGVEPGLWRVRGGNKQVPHRLLDNAKVTLIRSEVTEVALVSRDDQPAYRVTSVSGDVKEYEILILATPYSNVHRNIDFVNFPQPTTEPLPFHRTVATFVRGIPNYTAFGYSSMKDFPEEMLTCNNSLFFNSLGRQAPVDFDASKWEDKQLSPVWKVFSQQPLTVDQLQQLFLSQEEVKVVDWHGAYPHYSSHQTQLPKFELHDHLYYVSPLEMAASAMEMSAIAGRNVALLAYNKVHGKADRIDSISNLSGQQRVEL